VWQPFLFNGMVAFDGGGRVVAAVSFSGMECGSHFIRWCGGT